MYLSILVVVNPVKVEKNLEKPLLRRKSDLPADILTQRSLENYQVYNYDLPADILTKRSLENYQVYNYDLPLYILTQRSIEAY